MTFVLFPLLQRKASSGAQREPLRRGSTLTSIEIQSARWRSLCRRTLNGSLRGWVGDLSLASISTRAPKPFGPGRAWRSFVQPGEVGSGPGGPKDELIRVLEQNAGLPMDFKGCSTELALRGAAGGFRPPCHAQYSSVSVCADPERHRSAWVRNTATLVSGYFSMCDHAVGAIVMLGAVMAHINSVQF